MLIANFKPITFANKLDPDQDQQNVGSDLDPNLKEFLDKVIYFKKSADDNNSMKIHLFPFLKV